MKVKATATEDDLLHFFRSVDELYPWTRRFYLLAVVTLGTLIVGYALVIWISPEFQASDILDGSPVFLIVGMMSFLFVWFVFRLSFRHQRALRQTLKSRAGRSLLQRHDYKIEPEGIHVEWPDGESTYKWPAVQRLLSDDRLIYVYIGPREAMLIPRRDFSNPEEADRFVEMARTFRNAAAPNEVDCPKCGYELTGATSRKCPECGWNGD